MSQSNFIQVNNEMVYVIGGIKNVCSLLCSNYDVPRCCLQINLKSGEVIRRSKMNIGRDNFGICLIGHVIYVSGGRDYENKHNIRSCEYYNILTNRWTKMATCSLPDSYTVGMTTEVATQRYIFGFGGRNTLENKCPADNVERIVRLDTLKKDKGWVSLNLHNPYNENGMDYGAMPLGFVQDTSKFQFLIYGGTRTDWTDMMRFYTLTSDLASFESSSIKEEND